MKFEVIFTSCNLCSLFLLHKDLTSSYFLPRTSDVSGRFGCFYLVCVGKCVSSTQSLSPVLLHTRTNSSQQDTSRFNSAEQHWLLTTHAHTLSKPRAKPFHRPENGSPISYELSKNRKGQLRPVEMASLKHSITTLLQRANAYHIVITRFIFGLGNLCKQAFGVRGTLPRSPVFKRSKTLHVCTQAVWSLKVQAVVCDKAG